MSGLSHGILRNSAAVLRDILTCFHAIVQTWISTFPDMAALDAQFDEAKIAMGEIRSLRELGESEWADYWGAVQEVPDRSGGSFRLPGRPWNFASDSLDPQIGRESGRERVCKDG